MTTWNPSDKHADLVLSNGNLTVTFVDPAGFKNARSSTGKGSGKWYFEVLFGGSLGNCGVGVANASASLSNYLGSDSNSRGWYHTGFGGHTTFTSGDVIGVAVDADTRTLWFSKNGTFNGDPAAGTGGISLSITGDLYAAFSEQYNTGAGTIRPDAAAQDYSAPSGFSAWDAAASGSTGTLAATEAADTASFAGTVPIAGTLAATEGADSASFAGNVAVHGTLGASEGADTAAFEGMVPVAGTFAASEGADTAAFEGAVAVAGSLAASEAPDTVAMAGTVLIQGSLAATEASDTAAFSGSQVLTGTLAATEASDSASFSGKVVVAGALAASEEVDSASFAGTVRIGGTLGATESADGAAFGGLVLIQGGLSATEGADTAAFTSRPYVASARRTASSLRPSRTRASPSTNRVAASQR